MNPAVREQMRQIEDELQAILDEFGTPSLESISAWISERIGLPCHCTLNGSLLNVMVQLPPESAYVHITIKEHDDTTQS